MYIKGKYQFRSKEDASNRDSPRCLYKREYDNLINELRLQDGFTLQELADQCGATRPFLQELSQGMKSPFNRNGEVRSCVDSLCLIFNVSLGELFPFDICEINKEDESNYLTHDQMDNILVGKYTSDADNYYEMQDLREVMRDILLNLKIGVDHIQRNRNIFIRYWWDGLSTYREIGDEFELTGTSIMHIVNRGLRLLRHPVRSSKLRLYYGLKPFESEVEEDY